MCPTCRPITSTTMTRSCDSAVVWSRSMASVAISTAVAKPKVKSVPAMSLSIVLGTPTTGNPSSCISRAQERVPSPPTTTSASTSRASSVERHASTPPSTPNGWIREVPRTVPPRGRSPRQASTSRSIASSSMTPFQPSRKPRTVPSWSRSTRRTTARMTALRPGQSPPPVRMPMRMSPPPQDSRSRQPRRVRTAWVIRCSFSMRAKRT